MSMMTTTRDGLRFLAAAAVFVLGVACSDDDGGASAEPGGEISPATAAPTGREANDAQAVRAAFEAYRRALMDEDGDAAADRVTAETLEDFQQYRDWALTAREGGVRALSLSERMQVLLLRHRIQPEALERMDGRAAFVHAVDHGWVGKSGVVRIELHDITLRGARAMAVVGVDGTPSSERMHFRKQGGRWRVHLGPVMEAADRVLEQLAAQRGMTEDEFIFWMVTTLSGEPVTEAIWDPPR